MPVTIEGIAKESPAEKAGLVPGMRLLSIDGHEINDGLDYEFYSSGANLVLVLEQNGTPRTVSLRKQEYQQLGCEFPTYLIDKQHRCKNNCVFCFIDQMPKGLRPSLYFKDDDERLSFLFGNYVTLTNLTDKEVNRIIEMRISPVNISLHTANPALRVQMMKNKHAGEVLGFVPKLAEAGIQLNTQLVLCPGINDGDELRRSIEWISQFRPAVQSIAAVPVGITKFRQGLHPLQSYTAGQAAQQLDIMLEYGDRFAAQDGIRLVYPSDEWFILAGRPMPEADFYDGYPQLENGVGMCRLLQDEFAEALASCNKVKGRHEADLVVGTLAAPLLQQLADDLRAKFPNVLLHVHVIQNDFFGRTITVTGLLTGGDIAAQLKGRLKTSTLLLPEVTLRAEGDMFLDNMTVQQLAGILETDVVVVPGGGEELLRAALEA